MLLDKDKLQLLLSALGAALVTYILVQILSSIWHFTRPSSLSKYRHAPGGSWALVTGASDGIGHAFSDVLLERGFNVLLHGRNPDKLQRVRTELATRHPSRSVDVVVADASHGDDAYQQLVDAAAALPGELTVLVNNLGGQMTRPQFQPHWETPADDIDSTININARFPAQLTRALLPVLRSRGTPSLILTCGSLGGLFGVPYLATYTASKAFVHIFTRALQADLLAEGIPDVEVLGFLLGNVRSASNAADMPFTLSSRECAAGCLDRVGCGRALAWASWRHALQASLTSVLPEFAWRKIMAAEMRKRVEMERKGA